MTASFDRKLRAYTAALAAALILLTGSLFAQGTNGNVSSKPEYRSEISQGEIDNFAAGLESPNEGLKISCIYYAGFYELEELTQPLLNLMAHEKNNDTKILAAFALYKIGNTEGLKTIQNLNLAGNTNTHEKYMKAFSDNLLQGINSANAGLRKSAIYIAGFYRLNDLSDTLTKVFNNDTDQETKVLAALALYNMGDNKALKTLSNLSATNY